MAQANHASVKLSAAFLDEVRREAEIAHRSAGAQVEYWAKLGRAFERGPDFSQQKVRAALDGPPQLDGLSEEELDVALDKLDDFFSNPDEATRAYYAALGEQAGACGTDGKGGVLIHRAPARMRRSA